MVAVLQLCRRKDCQQGRQPQEHANPHVSLNTVCWWTHINLWIIQLTQATTKNKKYMKSPLQARARNWASIGGMYYCYIPENYIALIIIISITIMALQPCGHWLLFQFLNPIHS
jgi:hypothetical protein